MNINTLSQKITEAYWSPEEGRNPSANREKGDKYVSQLRLSDIESVIENFDSQGKGGKGPTFYMLNQRLQATERLRTHADKNQ